MNKINICLIKPYGYIHANAFWELAELIHFSLKELNIESQITFNQVIPSSKNILIGCHLLDPKLIKQIPKTTIVINTEQVNNNTTEWNEKIFQWLMNFEAWDYSKRNIEKLNKLGVSNVKHFKIGFQKELARLNLMKKKDVDVLFYGSVNERRLEVIQKLVASGLKVKTLFGVYGKERDEWVERSKLVLNHHYYNSQIFEIIRVFYLLTNSVAVVGEVNDLTAIDDFYREGIYAAKYDDLISACKDLIQDDEARRKLQNEALKSISRYPQKIFTKEILDL